MSDLLLMNTSPAEPEPVDPPRRPTRFTYASGAQPLAGYTIKRGVGAGGFGEVYFAVSDAGKEVALKLIRRNLEVELRGVKHCLNLKHPNLVALFDIRTDDLDDQWVVMEYVSGAALDDVIDRYPDGMPKDMALEWFTGIASAVAYLHDHGIVHRDLKPANIFLDEGQVKIGDYGLSKFIACSRRSGQTESVGTVHYMAPEIANGRYGREIDTYALGIIFYEMLTGHVPFEGESVGEVLMKHLTAEPDLTQVEEPYREIIRGSMAKDPDQRIKSVAEILAILKSEGRFEPVGSPTVDSPLAGLAARTAQERRDSSAEASPAEPQPAIADTALRHQVSYDRSADSSDSMHDYGHHEPIAAAVGRGWQNLSHALSIDRWNVAQQTIAVVLLTLAIALSRVWILMFFAGIIYSVYWVCWSCFVTPPSRQAPRSRKAVPRNAEPARRGMKEQLDPHAYSVSAELANQQQSPQQRRSENEPTPEPKKQPHSSQTPPWRRRKNPGWRRAAYEELANRTLKQRAIELLGTLLLSALVATACAAMGSLFIAPETSLELSLWMAVMGTAVSWAVIVPTKLTEGRFEDQAPMRFIQLLSGALVGLFASGLTQVLLLDLPVFRDFAPGPNDTLIVNMFGWNNSAVGAGYHSGSVSMPVAMYVAYFTLLFVVLRWSKYADYTRNSRVSLWTIAVCGAAAWGLTFISWFPQPIGMMIAMIASLTIQLSTHWLPPSRRRELAAQATAGEMV